MFGILICIAAGAAMSFQGVMNTRLGESIGTSEANAFVQATAAVLALAVLVFHRDGSFSALGEDELAVHARRRAGAGHNADGHAGHARAHPRHE